MIKALLWDVDGTLAETEHEGHLVAFNLAFESMGLPWRWDEARYAELLHVSGGRERILHDMSRRGDAPVLGAEREALARELHARKNARYADRVAAGSIPLREGVRELMDDCEREGVAMAIATTTSRSNLDALLRRHFGARWSLRFAAVVCGEDVARKKPDPEAFLRALGALQMDALDAVALEDSPGGVRAAQGADLPVVVTRSRYFAAAAIEGAIAIGPGLHRREGWLPALIDAGPGRRVGIDDLREWHARRDHVSQWG